MLIADKNGVWRVNKGNFAFVDPETGVRFEPGDEVKTTNTAWVKMQEAVLRPCADPTGADEPAAEAEQKVEQKAEAKSAKA